MKWINTLIILNNPWIRERQEDGKWRKFKQGVGVVSLRKEIARFRSNSRQKATGNMLENPDYVPIIENKRNRVKTKAHNWRITFTLLKPEMENIM